MHPALFQRPGELTQPDPAVAQWARSVLGSTEVSVANALQLCHAVADRVRYESGVTEVRTTAAQAFAAGRGVCQDQAHVMVLAARSLGWSARYVSGYFWADQEPDLASHAWVDVCLSPADGHWLSLDVTHRCPTDERHVRLSFMPRAPCNEIVWRQLRRDQGLERRAERRASHVEQIAIELWQKRRATVKRVSAQIIDDQHLCFLAVDDQTAARPPPKRLD
jgi:transglutaminase-like putative cysteine protease